MTMNENNKQAEPVALNIIRKWPDGFADRLQHVWLDVISFIPNVKLYDLQRVLAEFGFTMEVYEGTPSAQPVQPAGAKEPVGEVRQQISQSNTFVQWYKQPKVGDKLYTEAPAAAINEQLLEALENLALACGRNDGWEDYPQEMKAANAAIAAAEAEKAKGGANATD